MDQARGCKIVDTIDLKAYVDRKDLELFTKKLFEEFMQLKIENETLKEKLQHTEDLLKNANVMNLGE